jgi:hypothetical protein
MMLIVNDDISKCSKYAIILIASVESEEDTNHKPRQCLCRNQLLSLMPNGYDWYELFAKSYIFVLVAY